MDKFRDYIIFEIKRDEIKKINVHGVIRKIRPGDLVKASMRKPEFGNSEMMNKGVTGYWRGKIKQDFNNQES